MNTLGEASIVDVADVLKNVASTGDILLFSGRTWAARMVRWFTYSPWSHVAIVIYEPLLYAEPLVLEATRCSLLTDILCGCCVGDGVQLVTLADKLRAYPGRIVLRRWRTQQRPDVSAVRRVLSLHGKRPYVDYVRKNIRQWWGTPREKGTFCSELVADVLDIWGLFKPERPSRLYTPKHFAESLNVRYSRGTYPFMPTLVLKEF